MLVIAHAPREVVCIVWLGFLARLHSSPFAIGVDASDPSLPANKLHCGSCRGMGYLKPAAKVIHQ